MVGLYGKGSSSSVDGRFKGCTATEYRAHFALWCMLAAPLMVNSDLGNLDKETLSLLTNPDLIAIDQDTLGRQGYVIYKRDSVEVLKKELSKGDLAICVFNRSSKPVTLSIDLQKDLDIWAPYARIKDLFGNKYVRRIGGDLEVHEARIYRLNR